MELFWFPFSGGQAAAGGLEEIKSFIITSYSKHTKHIKHIIHRENARVYDEKRRATLPNDDKNSEEDY
jgi:hypothetical protein|tara:strand:+ start:220 stop:423 length:204 start_codon:yes stop_codon:yes gene_type:complete